LAIHGVYIHVCVCVLVCIYLLESKGQVGVHILVDNEGAA